MSAILIGSTNQFLVLSVWHYYMKNSSEYVRLFSNCIIVEGYARGLLCDLQNEKSYYLSKDLCKIARSLESESISSLRQNTSERDWIPIQSFVDFLIKNNFAFYCSEKELSLFPPLSMEWDYPARITNAIIDINCESKFDFENIFEQLEKLGCKDLQLRIYDIFDLDQIQKILICSKEKTLKSIELFLPNDTSCSNSNYIELSQSFPRITRLFVHSSNSNEILAETITPPLIVARIQSKILFDKHCGVFDERYFSVTTELFTESQHFNTCLNRKISIDSSGNIKNCPSMAKNFGNITEVQLVDALAHPDFTKYWNIKKDDVVICRDCEFRHICTDCRAFLQEPGNMNSKPLKCGYDPYTATWNSWKESTIGQKAIEYYSL